MKKFRLTAEHLNDGRWLARVHRCIGDTVVGTCIAAGPRTAVVGQTMTAPVNVASARPPHKFQSFPPER